ncbi:unnamed protein product [Cercopithifilaria johnstoni]|uniref:Uncharacterized protein n=1 Tax=Cercopithifilaria johnstoni TaxID=2874296 RepID=A0A8J2MAK1_9BILA|nr:unnamed protein product [Cercopithifilaria johnstoni]
MPTHSRETGRHQTGEFRRATKIYLIRTGGPQPICAFALLMVGGANSIISSHYIVSDGGNKGQEDDLWIKKTM